MTAVDHGELKRLADELRHSTALMACTASVRMDVWQDHSTSTLKAADGLDALLSEIEGLKAERDRLSSRNVEAAGLAYDWMVAHDSLKAGQPYDLPSPIRTQAPDSWRPSRREIERILREAVPEEDYSKAAHRFFQPDDPYKDRFNAVTRILALRPQTAESGK